MVQNGARAVSTDSGAVLALAPDPWTGGCATLDGEDVGANGYVVKNDLATLFDMIKDVLGPSLAARTA